MDALRRFTHMHAIEAVYHRYCDIIDSKEFERLIEVFTDDCVGDYRSSNGTIQNGVAPLVARLHRNMGTGSDCGATHHNVANIRIDVASETEATAKAHFYAVHQGINHCAGMLYTCWGEYSDRWIRTPAGWRVRHRHYRNFLTEGPIAVIRALHRVS